MNFIPYIIRTFRGGVSDESDKGVAGSFKHGQALNIHGRDDILTAKQAMATILDSTTGVFSDGAGVYSSTGTTMTGYFPFMIPATDGSLYCFSNTGSIFARSGDGAWTFVYNEENGAIKGAAEWKPSTGTKYLLWTTNTSIARKELQGAEITPDSGTARWTDVTANLKTTLDAADWHVMKIANGQLMFGNGNYLGKFDYDDNFNVQALNLIPGNLIKTLDERDDYVIMGSGRQDVSEEGHLWSWIVTAQNWIQKKRIPIQGVNAIINTELMLLQGGDDGEIFFSDFVNATPLHGVPGGGQVQPGGVTVEDDNALFGFYGGTYPGLWSYGRKRKNRPFALNYDYRLAKTVGGSTISTIGAVVMINGTLLAAWGTTDGSTSDYGVDSISSTTKATAVYEGLEFDGGAQHIKKGFDTVKLILSPLVAGTSVSVKYKLEKESSWRYAILGDATTTFSVTDATEAIFSIGRPANTYEVGVELNPTSNSSPEVHAIVTYVSKENQYDYA